MEIAKTLDFFCFRAETMKERFRRARVLLTEYHKIYPLIEQRLRDGLRAYFLRFVHYTWQCREYYKNNNERLRNVIVDDRERVVFLEQHLDDFIDQVIAEAFRNKMS